MTNKELFTRLAKQGFGGFIRLRSAVKNSNDDHKRPLSFNWTNPQNWFNSYDRASVGNRYGVGFALRNLVVIDVDKPAVGFDPAAYGVPFGRTPSGGYHLLFLKPKGVQIRGATKLQLPMGLCDIRTDGNQIVITHPLYQWTEGELKELPQDLLKAIEGQTMYGQQTVKSFFQRFVEGEVFGEGERNDALYRIAIGFLSLYRDLTGDDPDDDDWATLCEWLNEEAVDEPEENFERYYHTYLRYDTENIHLKKFLNSSRVRYGLELMGVHLEEERAKTDDAPLSSTLVKMTGLELIQSADNIEWLLDGVLPKGAVALLSAQPSVGKSTFLRQLAVCLTNGADFLGIATRPCRVVYYSNDEHQSFIGLHLRQLQERLPVEGVEFWLGNLSLEDFIIEASKLRDTVIIVDVLGRWFSDLKDYAVASKVMGLLRTLTQNGNTLILAHHAPRSENRALGVAAIDGAVDVEFRLYREGNQRYLDIDKRTVKKVFGLPLRFEDGWFGVSRKDHTKAYELLDKILSNSQDDYIFLDKIPAELMDGLNFLIAKGWVQIKTSAKGNAYIQLKRLNIEEIRKRLIEIERQYTDLTKPYGQSQTNTQEEQPMAQSKPFTGDELMIETELPETQEQPMDIVRLPRHPNPPEWWGKWRDEAAMVWHQINQTFDLKYDLQDFEEYLLERFGRLPESPKDLVQMLDSVWIPTQEEIEEGLPPSGLMYDWEDVPPAWLPRTYLIAKQMALVNPVWVIANRKTGDKVRLDPTTMDIRTLLLGVYFKRFMLWYVVNRNQQKEQVSFKGLHAELEEQSL